MYKTRWVAEYVDKYFEIPDGEDFNPDNHIVYGYKPFDNKEDAIKCAKNSGEKTWARVVLETDMGWYEGSLWLESWEPEWDTEEYVL